MVSEEPFVLWDGDYEKQPYEVKLLTGEVFVCYPNAGRMHDLKSGQCWWPHEVEGIRPTTWERFWEGGY